MKPLNELLKRPSMGFQSIDVIKHTDAFIVALTDMYTSIDKDCQTFTGFMILSKFD